MWDDAEGYDTADPKHSSYADRMLEAVDLARKKRREDLLPPVPAFRCRVDESVGLADDVCDCGECA